MFTTQLTQLTTQQLWRQKATRNNSVVKTIRVPESLYVALKEWSKNADCSMNALVRKALTTRFHNPNIPSPTECATRYLHVRVLHQEWELFKAYANAWKMPLWKALFLLLSRPYCIDDRPRATNVLHACYITTEEKEERREDKNMNECTCVTQSQNDNDPVLKGLVDIGVTYRVANDLMQRYDHSLLSFVVEKISSNFNVQFPAAFAVWWLKTGLAQWHYERELARKEQQQKKANEPLAPYHRKWSEMKEELGYRPVVNPEEWQRGLELMRTVLGLDKDREESEVTCVTCGRKTKRPTSTGQCSQCFEASLKMLIQNKCQQGGAL